MALSKKFFGVTACFLIITLVLYTQLEFSNDNYGPKLNPSERGHWGPLIGVGLVPVAAAVLPHSSQVLLWSADQGDVFQGKSSDPDTTLTALYDIKTNKVMAPMLSNLQHGMFCPGMSMDFNGTLMVTGGKTAARTSRYSDVSRVWASGINLTAGRGYHSQTTLSDGNTFTIGGSWSGGIGGDNADMKDGELFDVKKNEWLKLPGCKVEAMLTDGDAFESDNHAWLFAWKNSSVFQAGPSRAMNWFDTNGAGKIVSAGPRASDDNAMNGNAVMYEQGKILTLGGAPHYSLSQATDAVHLITLGTTYALPEVETLQQMHYQRVYANSVVLPTGDVFVSGGVSYAMQWQEKNATYVPELWSPQSRKFTKLARMNISRSYHSFAVLLPDATVLTGGGGLCYIECEDDTVNHMDLQIFTPPYLFKRNGRGLAIRPKIVFADASVAVGRRVLITTDVMVKDISMVRFGTATHSINTDQRRIALNPTLLSDSGVVRGWTYEVWVPDDAGVALPGYWMLFAVDDEGVPSVGHTVHIVL
ncbi:putative galactose oxidase precursor [Phaeosphaeria sp. MPI-PUGE-AT-0046c]|nr:putative galactose oxidase precursor [Phaeosphaeria sp. MPI-PUGE-AT-0046c]